LRRKIIIQIKFRYAEHKQICSDYGHLFIALPMQGDKGPPAQYVRITAFIQDSRHPIPTIGLLRYRQVGNLRRRFLDIKMFEKQMIAMYCKG
jgi:hypothetical protein